MIVFLVCCDLAKRSVDFPSLFREMHGVVGIEMASDSDAGERRVDSMKHAAWLEPICRSDA